ncbi:MAG: tryptophan halogenase family protein [Novosphingobium sp.]|uniref:tryptophan halogenase family protein n=1 Tax=Novosphingobium sp. TaxID=1874826 RepID=UPI0032BC4017
MENAIRQVAIVGGGTAGWLSACVLAAKRPDLAITLIESPDIPAIGVGEGTWPTMRDTLASIGISEGEFLIACDASFKQGSRFDGWLTGAAGESYLHPFTQPPAGDMRDLLSAWQAKADSADFATAMTAQAAVCGEDLAPRQRAMPDYAGALNYGYHLDAAKFAALLARHGTARLGVMLRQATVTGVAAAENGDIAALHLDDGTAVTADLFIDCSGQTALLIGGHCGADWIDRSDVSFNDRALALQVPVQPGSVIASQTIGTAHRAGWLWDIALPGRRGIGCVYSSLFLDDDRAEDVLFDYIGQQLPQIDRSTMIPRKLRFSTGHRAQFWRGNCLAIGLSAGFIEPLEASAIVLIELSLRALTENFPASRSAMDIHAERFNTLFRYRWDRIVEFLKLHYLLSRRTEPYWQAQRDPGSVPARLAQSLMLWRDQPPSSWDFPQVDEIFSAASQHYVLYGMGFPPPPLRGMPGADAAAQLAEVQDRSRRLRAGLPGNRAYLDALTVQTA